MSVLRQKYTKFDFAAVAPHGPAYGAYSAPLDPQLYLRDLLRRRGRGSRVTTCQYVWFVWPGFAVLKHAFIEVPFCLFSWYLHLWF